MNEECNENVVFRNKTLIRLSVDEVRFLLFASGSEAEE